MRKIKLQLDALRVETFDTGAEPELRGTVRGRHHTFEVGCGEPVDDGTIVYCPVPTAQATCGWTCGSTCTCGCTQTRSAWTCDPYASACNEADTGTLDVNVCP
ncbi:MAG TPA: hypothetical protein VHG91_00735 [Longimicrobium sp.]|nr:hypothetical protein [Longimicrobium sp.]